ncbi:MAG: hypothetical protein LUO80_00190 [Methylococcaceae bacterium]|nr:hypothetical protein [Methylococcaceae bacterium]
MSATRHATCCRFARAFAAAGVRRASPSLQSGWPFGCRGVGIGGGKLAGFGAGTLLPPFFAAGCWQGSDPKPHADYIDPEDFPDSWQGWKMTVDVEAKAKEMAVVRLMADLRTAGGI